jgi:hypothetical protein
LVGSSVRTVVVLLALLAGVAACQRRSGFVADVTTSSTVAGMPALSGKLYLRGTQMRLDWGQFADVFDIQQRKGWRIIPAAHAYQELGSKDLSTYAPEMTNGSPCPHAQVPSACKLVGDEGVEGRKAKKWDVYNPNGFHVYFWTDDALKITLRMAIGDAASYEVKNLTASSVPDSAFELPAGYEKSDRRATP